MRMLAVKKHDLASVARQRQVRGRCAGPGAGRAALPPARAERMNTTVLCQTVALGWSRCDPRRAPDAARRAQALLEALADLWGRQVALDDGASHRLRDVTPANTQLLNHVLTAWSKAATPTRRSAPRGSWTAWPQARAVRSPRQTPSPTTTFSISTRAEGTWPPPRPCCTAWKRQRSRRRGRERARRLTSTPTPSS